MFVKLLKLNLCPSNGYYLTEVVLNASQILYMHEDVHTRVMLEEGKIGIGLSELTQFTKIKLSSNRGNEEIVVIGDPATIESKMTKINKKLLWG